MIPYPTTYQMSSLQMTEFVFRRALTAIVQGLFKKEKKAFSSGTYYWLDIFDIIKHQTSRNVLLIYLRNLIKWLLKCET